MATSPLNVNIEVVGFSNYTRRIQRISARIRVGSHPELMFYKDILLGYDWTEEDHYKWVDSAPLDEILDWCKANE